MYDFHLTLGNKPTNSQLNIFMFEAKANLQNLLQSLQQNANKSARLGNIPYLPSFTGDLVLHVVAYVCCWSRADLSLLTALPLS